VVKQSQQGYSIIEVLITIVVIAFGFLALLALELRSMNMLTSGNQRILAFNIASSLGESIRANINNRASYGGQNTATFSKNCSTPANCTLVEKDIWDVKDALSKEPQLPSSAATITLNGGLAVIAVTWQQKDGTTATYSMDVPL